ncbi:bifunctional SAC3-GANP-THP3 [Babesia duncani]|uniref:Bifunctional SAC3-GANP-THP3 n=1 Tax=Babesia duncani TaxID=323732 RepID=A0AAD9PJN1_9APIC|nr:bifunctional SAC3-GANP-THP3 [Babesia duncani]
MFFAHFKQQGKLQVHGINVLGYSDELAGAEANRLMRQSMSSLNSQQQNVATPVNKVSSIPLDRMSLLSGVKISRNPKDTPLSFKIPLNTNPVQPQNKNVIPIMLKTSKVDSERKVRVADMDIQIPHKKTPAVFSDSPQIEPKKLDAPTTEEINKWIQNVYKSLDIAKCTQEDRIKVSKLVEAVMRKQSLGKLSRSELVIPDRNLFFDIKPITTNSQSQSLVSRPADSKPLVSRPADSRSQSKLEPTKLPSDITIDTTPEKSKKSRQPRKLSKKESLLKNQSMNVNELQKRQERSQRFQSMPTGIYTFNVQKGVAIVGQSQDLEKPFLRLTAEPSPLMVRPEPVLKRSFKHVFDTFLSNRNYRYIEEQFRSIRQDIQVQHLRSSFVVNLYATNARIALIHGDLDQFNQCQTQLIHLHRISTITPTTMFRLFHFIKPLECYGIPNGPYMSFANQVRLALSQGNFVRYFKLANTWDVDKEYYLNRVYNEAFGQVEPLGGDMPFYCKLTSLSLSLDTIKDALAFETMEECTAFVK